MLIDILTLFPNVFYPYLNNSIIGRAQEAALLSVKIHDLRDYATDKHRVTDEPPYGGGGGMVLKPEPIFLAVENIIQPFASQQSRPDSVVSPSQNETPIILLSPQGRPFNQEVASELVRFDRLFFICGRYEGVDERVRQHLVTDEISIGDFVITGGELAALIIVDAVSRLIPGVLGDENAAGSDSFATGLLEGPHYTRPEQFRDWTVPDVLRSGHAAKIARWRREQALRRTWRRRPELLITAKLSEEDKMFLGTLAEESASERAGFERRHEDQGNAE